MLTSPPARIWFNIHELFNVLRHKAPALAWMNFRLQSIANFNPIYYRAAIFNYSKTQAMLEFAVLCDILAPTESEAECQEQ